MTLESLERLRTIARNMAKGRNLENHEECNLLLIAADEIEREIAERYMELPVGADGVPIRVGDEMENGEYRGIVTDMSWDGHFWHVYHGSIAIAPCDYTHVKPDKLKERVRKFIYDRRGLNLKDPQEKADRMLDEFCADIREMAKEGEL